MSKSNLQTLGNYLVGEKIGAGLCEVRLVYDSNTSRSYAAKICKEDISRARLAQEASIIKALNQARVPNIINNIEFCDFSGSPKKSEEQKSSDTNQFSPYNCKGAMIMELATNQTLFDYISASKGLDEKLARSFFRILVKCTSTVHSLGYAHRDIKLENILIDHQFNLKLADFGFAKQFNLSDGDHMTCRLGTGYYMAPELRISDSYSGTKVDMFACGVLLFIMMFMNIPFKQSSATDILYRHFFDEKPGRYWRKIEKHFNNGIELDANFKALLNGLFVADPERRLSADQVLESEWMKGETYTEEEVAFIMRKNLNSPMSTTA